MICALRRRHLNIELFFRTCNPLHLTDSRDCAVRQWACRMLRYIITMRPSSTSASRKHFPSVSSTFSAAVSGRLFYISMHNTVYFSSKRFGYISVYCIEICVICCLVDKAMRDLEWMPKIPLLDGLRDSYQNDYLPKQVYLV